MIAALLALTPLDDNPSFGADPTPFLVMMLAGFLIGIAGHVVKARFLVLLGIGLIFLACFLLPLAANLSLR
ncbi:MAG TPA: hypothetical protein VGW11_02270 [Solirubrobacteraceae bacterium]|nr:hypothetical protein [Solirubrobacteraceae bacterium]